MKPEGKKERKSDGGGRKVKEEVKEEKNKG